MQTRPVVIGIGEILWDEFEGGRTLGGAPTNFAYHARQLEAESHPVSAIGNDERGVAILARLDELRIDRAYLAELHDTPTGHVTVAVDEKGKPDYTIHESVAWDRIPWRDELAALAGLSDAVCFGSLAQRAATSRATIRRFLHATRPEAYRIFDINLRQRYYDREVIADSLTAANVLKLNDEELPVLAEYFDIEGDDETQARALVRRFDLKLLALTMGSAGSLLLGPDRVSRVKGDKVAVADTVGAGDSFTAVLTMGLLAGADPDTINSCANETAAFVCTRAGATPAWDESLRHSVRGRLGL